MTITIYDDRTGEINFKYTPDMEPEHDGEVNEDGVMCGPFTIFYISGYEESDDAWTECIYTDNYYAIVEK